MCVCVLKKSTENEILRFILNINGSNHFKQMIQFSSIELSKVAAKNINFVPLLNSQFQQNVSGAFSSTNTIVSWVSTFFFPNREL